MVDRKSARTGWRPRHGAGSTRSVPTRTFGYAPEPNVPPCLVWDPRTSRQFPINHLGRPRQRAEAGVQSCGGTCAPEAVAAVLRRLDGVGQLERVLAALV